MDYKYTSIDDILSPAPKKKKGGCLKFFLFFILAIVIILIIVAIVNSGKSSSSNTKAGTKIGSSVPDDIFVSGCSDYFYSQLNEPEKELYAAYLRSAMKGELICRMDSVNLRAYQYGNLKRVAAALQRDRNDILFLPATYVYNDMYYSRFTENADGTYALEFAPIPLATYESTDLIGKSQKLSDTIDKICSQANQYNTEYEKAKFVHDYICQNAEYDDDTAAKLQKGNLTDPNDDYIYTAYGCLVDGECVCSGYARGFQAVMNALNIECLHVGGFGIGDLGNNQLGWGAHAWNIVKLDGNYYYVDVTWDDAIQKFDYFLIPTERLENDHCYDPYEYPFNKIGTNPVAAGFLPFDKVFDLPKCNDSQYCE